MALHILFQVTDKNNHRIRKISYDTGVTENYAGNGLPGFKDSADRQQAQFKFPSGITVDTAGIVYVADMHNHRIRGIATNGTVFTVAGAIAGYADLPGTLAMFNYPTGVTAAEDGTLYVADMNNHKIRKIFVTPEGSPLDINRLVVTLAGSIAGWKDAYGRFSKFHSPTGVAIHYATGDVYVADSSNQRIRKVDKYGNVVTIAGGSIGDSDGADAHETRFNFPSGITVDQIPIPDPRQGTIEDVTFPDLAPNVYFTDSFNNRIRALHRHWYDPQQVLRPGEIQPDYNCTTVAGSVPGYLDGYGNRSRTSVPAGLVIANSGVIFFVDANNVVRKIQRGSRMDRPMCRFQSGTCGIKRECRDLSGALCTYRPDSCLIQNDCLCDVLFHNATCNELVLIAQARQGVSWSKSLQIILMAITITYLHRF